MSRNKPLFWILTSEHGVMCKDKKWRGNAGGIEMIKTWKSLGWVRRFCNGISQWSWHAYAVYDGDTLDCLGVITRASGKVDGKPMARAAQ